MAKKHFFSFKSAPATSFQWISGGIAGGGYVKDISISNDGQTMAVSTDVAAGVWIRSGGTGNFKSAPLASDGVTSINSGGWAVVVAPNNSNRVYAVVGNRVVKNTNAGLPGYWTDTGHRVQITTENQPRGNGPFMAVSPDDADFLIVMDCSGVAHYTKDGGTTWDVFTALAETMLYHQVTNAASASGTSTLSFDGSGAPVPAAVVSHGSYILNCFDTTAWADRSKSQPFQSVGNTGNITATASSVSGIHTLNADVNSGDTITFGSFGCVAFDPSTSPAGIYIGTCYSEQTGVYYSANSGDTWVQKTDTGLPSQWRRLHCTSDGVLFLINWDVAPTDNAAHKVWRYVNVAPVGSGLSADTWTLMSPSSGSGMQDVTSDPDTPGRIWAVTANYPGPWVCNDDWGTTWKNFGTTTFDNTIGKPGTRYLGSSLTSGGNTGSFRFYGGYLYYTTGRGINRQIAPIYSDSTQEDVEGFSDDNCEVITLFIRKVPGGQTLIASSEDLIGLAFERDTEGSIKAIGIAAGEGNQQQGTCDWDKTTPTTVLFGAQTKVIKSTNKGQDSFTKVSPVYPAGGPLDGTAILWPRLAVQTAAAYVIMPANGGPLVTDDSGASFANCLFDGYALHNGWPTSYTDKASMLTCDLNNSDKYFCANRGGYASFGEIYRCLGDIVINNPGSGYLADETLIISGGNHAGPVESGNATKIYIDTVDGGGAITSAHVLPQWPGEYGTTPGTTDVATTDGSGTGATFDMTWTGAGGVYKSINGGFNWSKQGTVRLFGAFGNPGTFRSIPGYEDVILLGNGGTGQWINYPARVSTDGGITWHYLMGGLGTCYGHLIAPGKSAPGSSLPTIYIYGSEPGGGLTNYKIYRCENFDPDNYTVDGSNVVENLTWIVHYDSAYPNDWNVSGTSMDADPDEYGTIYWAFNANGFNYGKYV